MKIVEEQDNPNSRFLEISKNAILVLSQTCTVKTNRYYIPGETSVSERLRKSSFDSGIFTMLNYIIMKLKDGSDYTLLKQHLREKVLNYVELNDLTYHARVIKLLQENPE